VAEPMTSSQAERLITALEALTARLAGTAAIPRHPDDPLLSIVDDVTHGVAFSAGSFMAKAKKDRGIRQRLAALRIADAVQLSRRLGSIMRRGPGPMFTVESYGRDRDGEIWAVRRNVNGDVGTSPSSPASS
jgi:hypothetical protein